MKGIYRYIIIFLTLVGVLVSCSLREEMPSPGLANDEGSRLIVASVKNFSRHQVGTRAAEDREREINNTAVLLYGTPANGQGKVLMASPLYFDDEELNFVVNTTNYGRNQNANGITEQYISSISGNPSSFETFHDNGGNLENCTLYIVANMNSVLKSSASALNTESQFLNLAYNIPIGDAENAGSEAIDIPTGGFPMMGSLDIDLSFDQSSAGGNDESLTVPVLPLFAKVNLRFRVQVPAEDNPGDIANPNIPFFKPTSWKVYNIPQKVTFNQPEEPLVNPGVSTFTTETFYSFNFGEASKDGQVQDSSSPEEYVEISFYMPEYLLKASANEAKLKEIYPDNIDDFSKQYYKPLLCDNTQKPTYVEVQGKYSDYQGYQTAVTYYLYLGQNETDDFQIKRNQELYNTALIHGIKKHSDGDGVWLDHRVDVVSSGYTIAMERETRLDSHFEYRPMDITISNGDVIVVTVPKYDENGQPINRWFGAEVFNSANTSYEYDPNKPGFRRFFTYDLMDQLNANSNSDLKYVFRATNSQAEQFFRLWFYYDENNATYDASQPETASNQLFREGYVTVDYYTSRGDGGQYAYKEDGTGTPKEAGRKFVFRQTAMWVINPQKQIPAAIEAKRPDRFLIEYFEEYLYNYASDDNYGNTADGIKWGFNGEQLSYKNQAIYVDEGKTGGFLTWLDALDFNQKEFYNDAFADIDVKYDYYMTRDVEGLLSSTDIIPTDYAGLEFTKRLVTNTGVLSKEVSLSGNVDSAVEYCFNKNKRNNDGEVETIHWYLPAIDETEEILVDGFNYFPVFQSKFYWSSQPAFKRFDFEADASFLGFITIGNAYGYYYRDDVNRARATKVTATQTETGSGVLASQGELNIKISSFWGINSVNPGTERDYQRGDSEYTEQLYEEGNKSRTELNRVRCVYDPVGTAAPISPYPLMRIMGLWTVRTSSRSNTNQSNWDQPFTVKIDVSDDPSKGNVKLSCFLHRNYHSTAYPMYGEYNTETGVLTLKMPQKVGERDYTYNNQTRTSDVTPSSNKTPFELQFNQTQASFSVRNSNYLRVSYTDARRGNWGRWETITTTEDSYIRSFTKQQ